MILKDKLSKLLSGRNQNQPPLKGIEDSIAQLRKSNKITISKIKEIEEKLTDRKEVSDAEGSSNKVEELNKKVSEVRIRNEKLARQLSDNQLIISSPRFTPIHEQVPAGQTTKLLLADNYHINQKNFGSLFGKIAHASIKETVAIPKEHPNAKLMKACGAYSEFKETLSSYYSILNKMSYDDLLSFSYRNTPIIDISADEALSYVIPTPSWQSNSVVKDKSIIYEKLWKENREDLLLNCAACMFWTDFWADFSDLNQYDAAIVFSGSYIYGRTLLHLAKYTKIRCFVVESFATGHDFFFEERYSPIPNNSRVRNIAYRQRYAHIKENSDLWEREKIRSFNKLRNMHNKNVTQPPSSPLPKPIKNKRIMLILGQVVNDFSLISGCGSVLTSIPTYKELISTLLVDPQAFVIFKSHPWEKNKQNIKTPLTENNLRAWREELPDEQKDRLLIVSDWNLSQLLKVSEYSFTLCSQSALEAAMEGLKPVVIGGSFFDSAGFTSNFESASGAAEAAVKNNISGTMDLKEYSAFEDYLTMLIQSHLVNDGPPGIGKLTALLRRYKQQEHVKTYIRERSVMPSWAE